MFGDRASKDIITFKRGCQGGLSSDRAGGPIRRERHTRERMHTEEGPHGNTTQQEGGPLASQGETKPANTLIWDFQAPER